MSDLEKLYKEGASYKEIASQLGISEASVWRRIKKEGLVGTRSEYEDLKDQKFGDLTALELDHTGRYKEGGVFRVWKCQCVCGNVVKVRAGNLKGGQTTCKLCATKSLAQKLKQCSIDYRVWYRLVHRCRDGNLDLDVTPDNLEALFNEQRGRCAISGVAIHFGQTRKSECTASPDRIDPKKGYVKGNVRWVHKYVNSMRNDKETAEFIEWCRVIAAHNLH